MTLRASAMRIPPFGVKALQDKLSDAKQHSMDSRHSLIAAQPGYFIVTLIKHISIIYLTDGTNIIPFYVQFL